MTWPRLADISRLPLPGTDGPSSVRFTPDGSALTYLQAEPGSLVNSLWRHDLASGRRTRLAAPVADSGSEEGLSRREQLDRERRRTSSLGVTEYRWLWSAPRPTLLVPMGGWAFTAIGEETLTGVRPLPGVRDAAAVVGSPDGAWAAFVRDGDIWLSSLTGGEVRRLTQDATDGVFNGLAEYAAAEELGRYVGMWWSRDARQLAYAHVDERGVPPLMLSDPASADASDEVHRYPFAGGPNAVVSLRILAVDGGAPADASLPMEAGDYLARVIAHPGGGWLAAVLPRAQQELRWVRVSVDGTVRPMWTEVAAPWLNLDDDTLILPDGRVLRTTERTGFRHLELVAADGSGFAQLTAGDWMVTAVAHVDPGADEVFFQGTAHGATERHLYRVPLLPREPVEAPERLTREAGWHDAVFSRDGARWADTWSDLESAPRLVVHDRSAADEPLSAAPPGSVAATLGIRPPEMLELVAADGATMLHAALYRAGGGADDPPPCVVWVYAGPHAQYVKRAWDVTVHPLRQYLARAGVAVLVVDGRGSAFRGLAFESAIRGRLGTPEVEDQAAAVRQLAGRGDIDVRRVGITGGSYGGFMAVRAMALEPELFRVGVAVSPVTSWDGYDTAYTERYLGLPVDNHAAYAQSSALEPAERIRGDLLIIHGAIDENVHLRHSTRLIIALKAAGVDAELVVLPTDRHRVRTAAGLATRDRRTVRHLLQGLGVTLPEDLTSA